MKHIALCGLIVASAAGCTDEAFIEPLPDVVTIEHAKDGSELITFRDVADNGVEGNGFRFNGFRFNGFRFNGFRFNGFRFNGVTLNTTSSLTDVEYDSTNGTLQGTDAGSTVSLDSTDELLAEGDYDDGSTITDNETRVSEIEEVTSGLHPFQFQRVQTRVLETAPDGWGPWEDACHDGAGNPTKAILLKGDWPWPDFDRSTDTEAQEATTWACRGAALAKCVEWGYHPEGVSGTTVLADHHQACTRMVRADYCGNGEHHTENGTLIDVADSEGIQTHETTWAIEAAWGPDGALCVNAPRKTYWDRTELGCTLPTCGTDVSYWFAQGALLVTRNQPTALSTEEPAPPDSGG